MNIKKFVEHVRECAQCNGVGEVELMCRSGKVIASNISYAGVHSLKDGDAVLLTDTLDFIKANEFKWGNEGNSCADCGAENGQAHSVNCMVKSLLVRGGRSA